MKYISNGHSAQRDWSPNLNPGLPNPLRMKRTKTKTPALQRHTMGGIPLPEPLARHCAWLGSVKITSVNYELSSYCEYFCHSVFLQIGHRVKEEQDKGFHCLIIHLVLCGHSHTYLWQEWRPEGNPSELELSFHHVGPDGTQVIKFGRGTFTYSHLRQPGMGQSDPLVSSL